MVEVTKGVHAIDLSEVEGLPLECYLLNCDEGLILIDTGMRPSAIERIEKELKTIGKDWKDIKICLITHRHGDHIKNLKRVKELTDAEIIVHEGDAEAIERETGVEVKGVGDGYRLPHCGGIVLVHVPGHTDGNCCYYLPEKKAIIVGDTIFADEKGELIPPPEKYSQDPERAKREIKRLLNYDFNILLLTHGENILKDAKEKIKELCLKLGII